MERKVYEARTGYQLLAGHTGNYPRSKPDRDGLLIQKTACSSCSLPIPIENPNTVFIIRNNAVDFIRKIGYNVLENRHGGVPI